MRRTRLRSLAAFAADVPKRSDPSTVGDRKRFPADFSISLNAGKFDERAKRRTLSAEESESIDQNVGELGHL